MRQHRAKRVVGLHPLRKQLATIVGVLRDSGGSHFFFFFVGKRLGEGTGRWKKMSKVFRHIAAFNRCSSTIERPEKPHLTFNLNQSLLISVVGVFVTASKGI